jgi:hypothetical protein
MRKLTIFATAFLLILGLGQCKKEQSANLVTESVPVCITVKVGNNDSKAGVNPSNGKITFNNGDMLYVGYNNSPVGSLSYSSSTNSFSGYLNLTESGEQLLHFYYLGGGSATYNVKTGQYTVDISDQKSTASGNYPVISYGTSTTIFSSGTTSYTTTLFNKCALVKFNVSTSSESATCLKGMNNMVTVDFAENAITYGQKGKGIIKLPAGSGEKWAILLPQDALEAGEVGSVVSDDGWYKGTRGAMPAIENNGYLADGILVEVNSEVEVPQGAIRGQFTINSDGDKVFFSNGNLQYIGSAATPYWKFADSQLTYLGNNGQGSSATNVDRDLFGWGTSGYSHGAVCYRPWSTSETSSDYYAYGQNATNLYDQSGMADWGANPISNGGNAPNQWRTLTKDEWKYVFNSRSTTSGIRYAKARVNGVHGVILLPDDWSSSYYNLSNTNDGGAYYENNPIQINYGGDWNELEQHGAVFLPASGYREGTSVSGISSGSYLGMGWYWSASYYNGDRAYHLRFGNSTMNPDYSFGDRYVGNAVRLVRDVE